MKKSLLIIGLGILNVMHAGLHIIQFIQSFFLIHSSLNLEDHDFDYITHNPYFAVLWGFTGLFTLYVGIRDFHHHQHHKD